MDWRKHYENRTEHPESEAENVLLDSQQKILEIKKNIYLIVQVNRNK